MRHLRLIAGLFLLLRCLPATVISGSVVNLTGQLQTSNRTVTFALQSRRWSLRRRPGRSPVMFTGLLPTGRRRCCKNVQTAIDNTVAFPLTGSAVAPDLVSISLTATITLTASTSATDQATIISNAVGGDPVSRTSWLSLHCPPRKTRPKAVLELAAGNLDEAGYSAFLRADVRAVGRRWMTGEPEAVRNSPWSWQGRLTKALLKRTAPQRRSAKPGTLQSHCHRSAPARTTSPADLPRRESPRASCRPAKKNVGGADWRQTARPSPPRPECALRPQPADLSP